MNVARSRSINAVDGRFIEPPVHRAAVLASSTLIVPCARHASPLHRSRYVHGRRFAVTMIGEHLRNLRGQRGQPSGSMVVHLEVFNEPGEACLAPTQIVMVVHPLTNKPRPYTAPDKGTAPVAFHGVSCLAPFLALIGNLRSDAVIGVDRQSVFEPGHASAQRCAPDKYSVGFHGLRFIRLRDPSNVRLRQRIGVDGCSSGGL